MTSNNPPFTVHRLPLTVYQKLGLGTVQFGLDYGISNREGMTGIEEVNKILAFARGEGIEVIDTAFGYGKSEEVLGLAGVKDFKVVSKFLPESQGVHIKEQVKTSLGRLKTDQLYGLLAHRPLDVMENPGVWDYLEELKEKGVVKKIGFSFNKPEEVDEVLEKGFIPDLIQVPFNYLDKRFRDAMVSLKKKGCEIHTRSVFLQGLFFVPVNELPDFFEEIKPTLTTLQKMGEQLPGLLLKHCLEQDFIDKVIVGVNNLTQLKQNIEWLRTLEVLPDLNQNIKSEILTPSEWPKIK